MLLPLFMPPPCPPQPTSLRSEYETWLVSEYADRGSLADAVKREQFKAADQASGCDMVGGWAVGCWLRCSGMHVLCISDTVSSLQAHPRGMPTDAMLTSAPSNVPPCNSLLCCCACWTWLGGWSTSIPAPLCTEVRLARRARRHCGSLASTMPCYAMIGRVQLLHCAVRTHLPTHPLPLPFADLKKENVLLKSERRDRRGYVCKLGDFGLSRCGAGVGGCAFVRLCGELAGSSLGTGRYCVLRQPAGADHGSPPAPRLLRLLAEHQTHVDTGR